MKIIYSAVTNLHSFLILLLNRLFFRLYKYKFLYSVLDRIDRIITDLSLPWEEGPTMLDKLCRHLDGFYLFVDDGYERIKERPILPQPIADVIFFLIRLVPFLILFSFLYFLKIFPIIREFRLIIDQYFALGVPVTYLAIATLLFFAMIFMVLLMCRKTYDLFCESADEAFRKHHDKAMT